MTRLAAWAWITVSWLTVLAILVAAYGAPTPLSLTQHLAAGALVLMFLLLSCVMMGSPIVKELATRMLLILTVLGFIVMVVLMMAELRQKQRWQLMIQPPGVPAIALDTSRYETWEACEAERVRLIQADIWQARQPTPLVCKGRYAWWELLMRSSPRAKRSSQ